MRAWLKARSRDSACISPWPLRPRGLKVSKVRWLSSSRWLMECSRSRTCSLMWARRQEQTSSRPKRGSPSGTSARRYPIPWQYGQFGSPSISVFDVVGELALDVLPAIFFSVSSILLLGTPFFLPALEDGFAIPPAALVVLHCDLNGLCHPQRGEGGLGVLQCVGQQRRERT